MKKKFLIAGAAVLAAVTCAGILSAYGLTDLKIGNKTESSGESSNQIPDVIEIDIPGYEGFASKEQQEKLKEEKQRITNELNKQIAEGKDRDDDDYEELSSDDLDELQKKFDAFDKEEEKLDKLDLNAYPIVAKYCGEEYNRDELVNDYDTEISYMEKMCELYNSGKLTEDEKETLYNYVDRRTTWISDMDLKMHFVEEIGAPY